MEPRTSLRNLLICIEKIPNRAKGLLCRSNLLIFNNFFLLDTLFKTCYNYKMIKRKKRSDRRHMVYMLQNVQTGEFYIGMTQGFRQKDLRVRVLKHFQRARTENKSWALCENIRKFGSENFFWTILEVVRGKTQAHNLERALTAEFKPELNSV